VEAGPFISVVTSPLGLLACLGIGVAGLLAYLSLRRRWAMAEDAAPGRSRDAVVLVATMVAAWLLVMVGGVVLAQRDSRERMQTDLADRSAQSLVLRTQIRAQIDATRSLLGDRAVEKVTQERLAEARAELARFAAFQDPGINQMITLIDREIAIRAAERERLPPADGE